MNEIQKDRFDHLALGRFGHYLNRLLPVFVSVLMASACSSHDSLAYEHFKCGKVAHYLGKTQESRVSLQKSATHAEKVGKSPGYYSSELGQRFVDDVELHRYNSRVQLEILMDIYKSGTCQKSYDPSKT